MQHTWTSSKRRLPRHSSAICLMLSTTTQVLALLCSALHSAPLRSTPLHPPRHPCNAHCPPLHVAHITSDCMALGTDVLINDPLNGGVEVSMGGVSTASVSPQTMHYLSPQCPGPPHIHGGEAAGVVLRCAALRCAGLCFVLVLALALVLVLVRVLVLVLLSLSLLSLPLNGPANHLMVTQVKQRDQLVFEAALSRDIPIVMVRPSLSSSSLSLSFCFFSLVSLSLSSLSSPCLSVSPSIYFCLSISPFLDTTPPGLWPQVLSGGYAKESAQTVWESLLNLADPKDGVDLLTRTRREVRCLFPLIVTTERRERCLLLSACFIFWGGSCDCWTVGCLGLLGLLLLLLSVVVGIKVDKPFLTVAHCFRSQGADWVDAALEEPVAEGAGG